MLDTDIYLFTFSILYIIVCLSVNKDKLFIVQRYIKRETQIFTVLHFHFNILLCV